MRPVLACLVAAWCALPAIALGQDHPGPAGAAVSEDEEPWFGDERGFVFELSAGPAYRQVYSVPIVLAHATVGAGAQTVTGAWLGTAELLYGATDEGLRTLQSGWGLVWTAPVGPWRLGFGPRFSWLGIHRATTDELMWDLALGTRGCATLDLAHSDHAAVFAGLEASADAMLAAESDVPLLWGATLRLGTRVY